MKKKNKLRLAMWQERFENSKNGYTRGEASVLDHFDEQQAQYDGSKKLGGGKEATTVWNITSELIESQIDSGIPIPKVTPHRPTPRTLRNAQAIQDMLKFEMDRLPSEVLNDSDERLSKINGGTVSLVEWDMTSRTHDTVGDISIRLLGAKQFIPQECVYETRYMDYLFLTFDDTKERIKRRYGVDVTEEGTDPELSDSNSDAENNVTQIIAYFKNENGGLGCFSWVGDTVLIDDDNYEARKDRVCAKCGRVKPADSELCTCGACDWTARSKEYEELSEDLQLETGETETVEQQTGELDPMTGQPIIQMIERPVYRTVPAMSPERIDGEFVMEDYQEPMYEQLEKPDGNLIEIPVMDYLFDERGLPLSDRRGNPLGIPKMQTKQRVRMIPTRIPCYYPRAYPVSIRKNISQYENVLGISDCDTIHDFQVSVNRMLTKRDEVVLKSGSVIFLPKGSDIKFTDEALRVIEVKPEFFGKMSIETISSDVRQYADGANSAYDQARSILGVTDSFQGKPDATATSGKAKEALIAQATGRQKSKKVMKNAAWADKYEMIFKFMLAYSDEPRCYSAQDEDGQPTIRVFNKYDFLEQDEFGCWYYDDEYSFGVDESGIDVSDKKFMLEDLRTDLSLGAYGEHGEPETMLAYWEEKEIQNYPNAARNVKKWQRRVEEAKEQRDMMMQSQRSEQTGEQIAGHPHLTAARENPLQYGDIEHMRGNRDELL
ncbi:MAG: hypothetical protein RR933_00735 [Oscillospiraceae bacterium]